MWVPLHLVNRNGVLRIVEGETECFPLVVEEKQRTNYTMRSYLGMIPTKVDTEKSSE